jgi:amidase
VFGHKPTFGLVPARGHIPPIPAGTLRENDINVVGPLARDPRDLDLALAVLAGPISQEALGWKMELPGPLGKPMREFRVAIWADDSFCPVDSGIQTRLHAAAVALRSAGAAVDEDARPSFRLDDSHHLYLQLLRPAFGAGLTYENWLKLDDQRQHYRDLWADFFARYDLLISPTCSVPAFPHQQGPREERRFIVNGVERPYDDFIVWPGLVSVSYLPSTSTPIGVTAEGLPVGVQVVGPHLSDRRTIRFAGMLAELTGGVRWPAGY